MNFSISGHHITITDAIRAHAEKKAASLTNRMNNIISIDLTITQDQTSVDKFKEDRFKIDGKVHIKDNSLVATAHASHGSEVYNMIDQVITKLEKQVTKQKGKTLSHKKGNASIKHLEVADQSLI